VSRQSAAAIGTAGGLVVVGSLLPWAIGDVLNSGASVTGVEFVEGDLTFLMGAVIGVIGLLAWRSGGRSWTRLAVALLALVCLSIVAYVFATLAQRLEGWTWLSPGGGLIAVVVGGVVALVGAFRRTSPEAVRVSPT
jgi:peptidoglycan/LPS O-acetylase OafA/YrhL